jgi:hypothetical protein
MNSWVPWIASWYPVPHLNRKSREALINILYHQPIEFRIALLNYQIRKLFPSLS